MELSESDEREPNDNKPPKSKALHSLCTKEHKIPTTNQSNSNLNHIITHLARFYCIPTGRHKSMSRPAQEGISHLQDAQDLVPGLGLAQDLVRPADEKSLPFLCMANALHKIWCVLQMRNQFKVNLTPYF